MMINQVIIIIIIIVKVLTMTVCMRESLDVLTVAPPQQMDKDGNEGEPRMDYYPKIRPDV